MFDFEKVKNLLIEKGIAFEVVEFPDEVISARLEDNSLTKNFDPKNSIKTLVTYDWNLAWIEEIGGMYHILKFKGDYLEEVKSITVVPKN